MIQGHRNPFGKPLPEYTTAELDFVLEMAAIDEPDRYTFERQGQVTGRKAASARAAEWHSVLAGSALMRWMAKTGLSNAMASVANWQARRSGGMRTGLTRGGKEIDDVGLGRPDNRA